MPSGANVVKTSSEFGNLHTCGSGTIFSRRPRAASKVPVPHSESGRTVISPIAKCFSPRCAWSVCGIGIRSAKDRRVRLTAFSPALHSTAESR